MAEESNGGFDKLRVAVLGYGRMGKLHAENLRKLGVTSICTVDVHDAYPKEGEVDAIIISSWSALHEEHIKVAHEAGNLPVYCEKPLAHTLGASLQCKQLLRQYRIKLMMGFQRRFDPSFVQVKQQQVSYISPTRNVLITSRDPQPPPAEYLQKMGSHFMDMTIHDIDEARWLLEEEPSHVYAHVDSEKMHAFVCMRTPSEKHCQILNSRHCSYGYDQRVEVFGVHGRAAADAMPENPEHFFTERYDQAYREALRIFLQEVVQQKHEPRVGAADGIRAAVIAKACEKSAALGQEVAVPSPGEEHLLQE